jgi:uncharacterized caspase-like protein
MMRAMALGLPSWLRVAGLAALLSACTLLPKSEGSDRLALVIGNAAYQHVPALKNPVNDADDMCASLRRLGFRTLCHRNVATRAEFEALVEGYAAQLRPTTVGLVYFSGHGVQAGGANHLVPTAFQPRQRAADTVAALYGVNDLFGRLRRSPSLAQLLILDACRTELSFAGGAAGLSPITDAPPGAIVLFATGSGQAAFDGEGRNGPLTKHVLAHIATPNVQVEEFIKRVTAAVQTETLRDYRRRQTPFTYSSFSGRLCLAGCIVVPTPL